MRIALAKLLLREPSLLLLDEPTNHLDLDSLRWLENYLTFYDGAILLISHDRAFLDALCDRTFHLNQRKLDAYKGNYSYFEKERVKRRELLLKAAENQRREREHLQGFVDRFRAKASKASQAQSRMKKLEKMEVIEVDEDDSQIGFSFPPPKRSGQVVLKLEGLSKSYGNLQVIRNLDLEIQRGDRVAIVGVNGAGKSTLTRIIAGVESFQSGDREPGYQVELSYFAQNQADELDPNMSVLDLGTEVAPPEVRSKVRSILGSFLFRGNDVFKKAKVLSGGEKNRLALARMLMRPANFLVFDEPTNHLDMRSKSVLQEAIKAYAGTVVIVSHDRAFLDPLVNRVIEVRKDGVRCMTGNVSDYIEKLKEEAKDGDDSESSAKKATPTRATEESRNPKFRRQQEAERRRQLSELKKKTDALENRAAELERKVAEFETAMTDPEFFKAEDHQDQVRDYNRIKTELQQTLSDWERVSSQLESSS
jgi:ATP-binding cassette subfamily F protein 3